MEPFFSEGLKLLLAVILGGAVGLERELVGKPAGLRTNVLIAVGSTLITLASVRLAGGSGDPARVAAQIVSGVGFIGAGTILQSRGAVVGLTTAATIWAVAGIGIAIGAGATGLAIATTVLIVVCLTSLRWIEGWDLGRRSLITFEVRMPSEEACSRVLELFSARSFAIEHSSLNKKDGDVSLVVSGSADGKTINRLLTEIGAQDDVVAVKASS